MGQIHGGRLVRHSRYPTILYYLQLGNPSAARSRPKGLARWSNPQAVVDVMRFTADLKASAHTS
jgi:hypothetical protein